MTGLQRVYLLDGRDRTADGPLRRIAWWFPAETLEFSDDDVGMILAVAADRLVRQYCNGEWGQREWSVQIGEAWPWSEDDLDSDEGKGMLLSELLSDGPISGAEST